MADDITRQEKLRLEEYREASNLSRNYENLFRITLSIFIPTAIAIIGFLFAAKLAEWQRALISLGGTVLAGWIVYQLVRLRLLYRTYVRFAQGIEEELGLRLFREARVPLGNRRIPFLTNKVISIVFVSVIGVLFLASTIVFTFRSLVAS